MPYPHTVLVRREYDGTQFIYNQKSSLEVKSGVSPALSRNGNPKGKSDPPNRDVYLLLSPA